MRVRQLKFGEVPAVKKFETWSDQKSNRIYSPENYRLSPENQWLVQMYSLLK